MSAVNSLPASGAAAEKRPYEPSMEEILASIRRIIADDQTLPGKALMPEVEAPASLLQPVSPPEATPLPAPRDEIAKTAVPQESRIEPAARISEPQIQPQTPPDPIRETAPVTDIRAHGVIAAPQFAAPHGPASDPEPQAQALQEMRQTPQAAPEAPAAPTTPAAFEEDDESLYDEAIEPAPLPLQIGDDVPPAPAAALFSSATDTSITSAFNMLAASRLADNSDELMNLAREMIRPLLRSWIDDNLPSMVERMVRAEIERVARGGR